MSTYNSLRLTKSGESSKVIISCATSYIFISFMRLFGTQAIGIYLEAIFACAIAFIFASLLHTIVSHSRVNGFVSKLFNISLVSDPFEDIINMETGATFKVQLNGRSDYLVGFLHSFGNSSNSPWVVLANPRIMAKNDQTGTLETVTSHEGREGAYIMFKLSDASVIEVLSKPSKPSQHGANINAKT